MLSSCRSISTLLSVKYIKWRLITYEFIANKKQMSAIMKKNGLYGVVLAVLVGIFAYHFILSDSILARGDTFTFFYPYWDARNEALREGLLPLWTPHLFMGSPLLAEPQLGTYYPPNWLTLPLSNAPDAVELSVLLHLFWGALGVFVLFNHLFPTRGVAWGGLAASITYMFSGNVLGHIEQVNQLQGLAWLGWLFWLWHQALASPRKWLIPFGMAWGVLFFIGHTQTVFVAGIGLGVYALVYAFAGTAQRPRLLITGIGIIALAGIIGMVLSIPQFYPTLELTGMSNRGGGGMTPHQATAFSLAPHYLGRALLPNYDGLLYTEYIGYFGIVGILLALFALLSPHESTPRHARWTWGAVALLGLVFALGRFNPLYLLLANFPPFNLFRVPARWLALLALGGAMLAGLGLQSLARGTVPRPRTLGILAGVISALAALAWGLPTLFPSLAVTPTEIRGASIPTLKTLFLWATTTGIALLGLWWVGRGHRSFAPVLFFALAIELWGASQVLPMNELAPRETYLSQRFTTSSLKALQADEGSGRVLAISDWLFDVGDKETLRTRYETNGFSEEAIQVAFTSTKRQEMLAPNLSQKWGIPAVDGYGGGLLPTMLYSQFTSLLLPPDTLRTIDGRIGEALAQVACRGACIPKARWLDLMNVRYLVVDKIYDVWHEGIAFDTALREGKESIWLPPSPLITNRMSVLYTGEGVQVFVSESSLSLQDTRTLQDNLIRADYVLDETSIPEAVRVVPRANSIVLGVTFWHDMHETFVQLAPQGWRRVLSSDVKVYERQLGVPRAYLVSQRHTLPDTWQGSEDALVLLQQDDFNHATQVILHGDAPPLAHTNPPTGTAQIMTETDTRIALTIETDQEAYLVLLDSHYPHWQATVNGTPTTVHRANVLFRAVRVPAGNSEVVFTFTPTTWTNALVAGGVAWGVLVLVWFGLVWSKPSASQTADGQRD